MAEHFTFMAFYDELTSLYNRSYLMSRLKKLYSFKATSFIEATLISIDLNGFKEINNSMGHLIGDLLLKNVARRLQSCVRDSDIVARIGGDEFAVLLIGSNKQEVAADLARRIIQVVQKPASINDRDVFISCSIGIVEASKEHSNPEELLKDAEIAVCFAKRQGSGELCILDSMMRDAALKSSIMQRTMRQALINNEFFLLYQPIITSDTGKCAAYEVLVRWHHPQLGILSPDTFIPLAELNGFINEIGTWVMKRACADLYILNVATNARTFRLNINLSVKELMSAGFVSRLSEILSSSRVAPEQIQLEITESVFIHYPELANTVLEKLRGIGARIALDDFGTGYSSLSYMVNCKVDGVKIDKSFVSALASNERSRTVVKGIVSLCSDLNLETTAEGVESIDQEKFLKELKCTYLQGFLFSEPLCFDKLINYIGETN